MYLSNLLAIGLSCVILYGHKRHMVNYAKTVINIDWIIRTKVFIKILHSDPKQKN